MAKKTLPVDKTAMQKGNRAKMPESSSRPKAVERGRSSGAASQSIEEQLAQRNAELAIINAISQAMVQRLDTLNKLMM